MQSGKSIYKVVLILCSPKMHRHFERYTVGNCTLQNSKIKG